MSYFNNFHTLFFIFHLFIVFYLSVQGELRLRSFSVQKASLLSQVPRDDIVIKDVGDVKEGEKTYDFLTSTKKKQKTSSLRPTTIRPTTGRPTSPNKKPTPKPRPSQRPSSYKTTQKRTTTKATTSVLTTEPSYTLVPKDDDDDYAAYYDYKENGQTNEPPEEYFYYYETEEPEKEN
uniref:Uncharacterized protein n=1 Tax=Parastrongyloides trichosuri TaxID=131310 RepID=A0A0N4ZLN2_PARTI